MVLSDFPDSCIATMDLIVSSDVRRPEPKLVLGRQKSLSTGSGAGALELQLALVSGCKTWGSRVKNCISILASSSNLSGRSDLLVAFESSSRSSKALLKVEIVSFLDNGRRHSKFAGVVEELGVGA